MHRTFKVTGKSQADGAQTIDLTGYERVKVKQVQVDLSADPAAGTLDVSIRTPGAADYVSLGTINLADGPLAVVFEGYCDSIKLTPASLTAGVTYNAYVFCLQV